MAKINSTRPRKISRLIKSNASGFHSFDNYRSRILFFCGELTFIPYEVASRNNLRLGQGNLALLTMIHSGHASKSELSWSFADSTRLVCVRGVMLAACAVGMLTSSPLWANSRSFPLLPLGGWFPVLQSPWDVCLLSGTIFALVLALRFHQLGVGLFLVVRLLGVSGPEPASAVVLSLRRVAFADPVPRTGGARGLPCGPIRRLRLGWVAQIQCSFLSRSLSVSGFTHCGPIARLGCDIGVVDVLCHSVAGDFRGRGTLAPALPARGHRCGLYHRCRRALGAWSMGYDFYAVV